MTCRICRKSESSEMFRLSDPAFDGGRTTAQVIEDCFGLTISEVEMFSLCCIDCKRDLSVAWTLVKRIRESDIRLQMITFPKVEIVEPVDRSVSSVFIDETRIKCELTEEINEIAEVSRIKEECPPKAMAKKRRRPRKQSIAPSVGQLDLTQKQTFEQQVKQETPRTKRRTSICSAKSEDGISVSSSEESDEPDCEADINALDEFEGEEEQKTQGQKRRSYGVKANSQPRRCCSCKNVPLDSQEKVREHSEACHLTMRITDPKDFGDKIFECSVCFMRFDTKKLFLQHQRKMYVDVLHSCKQCDEQFANFYVFQKHVKTNHQRRLKTNELEEMRIQSNICCGCREKFGTQEELKEHAVKVHLPQREAQNGENTVECDVCYKGYKSARYLKYHRIRFFKKNHLICTHCGRSFRERYKLEEHEDSHRNVLRYECPICHAKFAMKGSWKVHVKQHNSQELFHCEYCGKGFRQKAAMKAHLVVHSADRPHKCPICPLTFTQTSRLNSHMLEHSGMKSFKCDRCPASYLQQRNLRRHVREKHEGIQSFQCSVCSKGFIAMQALTTHMRTHERSREATFLKS